MDYRSNEAIAAPRHRFDEPGIFRRISERRPQLPHGRVQGVVEFHEGLVRPKLLANLVARDNLTRLIQ